MCNGRDILIYLAVINNGDWDKTYSDITSKRDIDMDKVNETVKNLKCQALTIVDKDYPEYLKHIVKPPIVLFYYGDRSLFMNDLKLISVVGSRLPSEYGERATRSIVSKIAKHFTIVSGLARGIDTIAHKEAIKAGGKTIAILGSGIDTCYPRENFELYREIKKNHLLVSEYPGDTGPDRTHFPFRNRLIGGLGVFLLLGEGKDRSGSLISVNAAMAASRTVGCIPHPIDYPTLNNDLIQTGALLVRNADDIYYELGYQDVEKLCE